VSVVPEACKAIAGPFWMKETNALQDAEFVKLQTKRVRLTSDDLPVCFRSPPLPFIISFEGLQNEFLP